MSSDSNQKRKSQALSDDLVIPKKHQNRAKNHSQQNAEYGEDEAVLGGSRKDAAAALFAQVDGLLETPDSDDQDQERSKPLSMDLDLVSPPDLQTDMKKLSLMDTEPKYRPTSSNYDDSKSYLDSTMPDVEHSERGMVDEDEEDEDEREADKRSNGSGGSKATIRSNRSDEVQKTTHEDPIMIPPPRKFTAVLNTLKSHSRDGDLDSGLFDYKMPDFSIKPPSVPTSARHVTVNRTDESHNLISPLPDQRYVWKKKQFFFFDFFDNLNQNDWMMMLIL